VKYNWIILTLFLAAGNLAAQDRKPTTALEFLGEQIALPYSQNDFVDFPSALNQESIEAFNQQLSVRPFAEVIQALLNFRDQHKLDDWLYYQLIRRTAQLISPKADNYHRYTLYKWYLLIHSGYDAMITYSGERILFYVRSDENIYNIPSRLKDGKQFVCLNYHDYGFIDFEKYSFTEFKMEQAFSGRGFSYRISQLPDFKVSEYEERDLQFTFYQHLYQFKIKLNPLVKTLFTNYPVVDYESYFNIPLSSETYRSLIPTLRKNISGMSVKNGVEYLMRFTRDAFGYLPDSMNFGKEKRLSPEQTLLYGQSDCEDRAALFFCLVKEIYNLPMIVLAFPNHVTIAVNFDKPVGKSIWYNGKEYSVCEPTPQKEDLQVGQLSHSLRKSHYEIAYSYMPQR
jgi:hypothetical protein